MSHLRVAIVQGCCRSRRSTWESLISMFPSPVIFKSHYYHYYHYRGNTFHRKEQPPSKIACCCCRPRIHSEVANARNPTTSRRDSRRSAAVYHLCLLSLGAFESCLMKVETKLHRCSTWSDSARLPLTVHPSTRMHENDRGNREVH